MKKLISVFALACIFYVDTAKAQNDGATIDTISTNFIAKASVGGMKEVQTGQLATTKGQSSSVKSYGAMMVNDHNKANSKLMKLAKMEHYNVSAPPDSLIAPDPVLAKSSGADFDRLYVKLMIMDHEQTIALFQHEANNGIDPEIKAFASETLPTLKMHLADIQNIAKQMGLPTN